MTVSPVSLSALPQSIVGATAPFVGLFGTVLGVIEAFHQLGDTGNKDAMGNVMAGIAEALVAEAGARVALIDVARGTAAATARRLP